MKNFALALIIFISPHVHAQSEDYKMDYNPENQPIKIGINLGKGIFASIQMRSWSQLDSLPDLDDLLSKVRTDLSAVWDTVYNPKHAHKISYHDATKFRRFVVTSTEKNIQGFISDSIKGVTAFRNISDTLKFSFFTTKPGNKYSLRSQPLYLTLTFNSLENLKVLSETGLEDVVNKIKEKATSDPAYANSTLLSVDRDSAYSWKMQKFGSLKPKKTFFEPDLYIGFQFARGEWITSAAAGLQLIKGNYDGERNAFKLLWEPHFTFALDEKGKRELLRDDFITFRFYEFRKEAGKKIIFPTIFSAGYLVRNKGDVFEKNTFKFSIAGLQYMGLTAEPEFFFNDLFRNFSPSLKLNYNID